MDFMDLFNGGEISDASPSTKLINPKVLDMVPLAAIPLLVNI